MRRKPKTELDPSEPYRSYRVLDATVPDATVPDATVPDATNDGDKSNIFVAIIMIVLSIASIGFYVGIFAVVALVVAKMFGLIDWEFW